MDSVYLETSFISVLAARPSRDLLTAANQQISLEWWNSYRTAFNCVISSEVLREATAGDPNEVSKRLELVTGLHILTLTPEAERVMLGLLKTGALPPKAAADAAHLAIAAAAEIDYLLTWNFRHLANAQILRALERASQKLGCRLPNVCTPSELMGD
jgi:hypothetical protein